jgi:hypothetical protein
MTDSTTNTITTTEPVTVVGTVVSNQVISGNAVISNNEVASLSAVAVAVPAPLGGNELILTTVKDIIFNLILNSKPLRAKLDSLLEHPTKAIEEITKVFQEVSEKIPAPEMDKLRRYISMETTRTTLGNILQNSFNDIMADGKIDMNDANAFITLIYNIVSLFNESSNGAEFEFTLSGEIVMNFLLFVLKATLILTLDGEEEKIALSLLDTSFKLVSLSVMPLTKRKCKCNPFACCFKKN